MTLCHWKVLRSHPAPMRTGQPPRICVRVSLSGWTPRYTVYTQKCDLVHHFVTYTRSYAHLFNLVQSHAGLVVPLGHLLAVPVGIRDLLLQYDLCINEDIRGGIRNCEVSSKFY